VTSREIFSGFKAQRFGKNVVPSSAILLELLYPSKHFREDLVEPPKEWAMADNLESQQTFQARSNWLVQHFSDFSLFEPLCKKMGLDFLEISYLLTLMEYLEHFLCPPPNYSKFNGISKDIILGLHNGGKEERRKGHIGRFCKGNGISNRAKGNPFRSVPRISICLLKLVLVLLYSHQVI
jgi:hypothetical protein